MRLLRPREIAAEYRTDIRNEMMSSGLRTKQHRDILSLDDAALLRKKPELLPACCECGAQTMRGVVLTNYILCDSCIETLTGIFSSEKKHV